MIGDDSITSGPALKPEPGTALAARQRAPSLSFGPFVLHPDPLRLCLGQEELRLGGRALDLLVALTSRPGEVLSRSALEMQVWPHSVVEDSSLRVHIAALRRALSDGIDGARYILNVPGRGYSFVAPVTPVSPVTPVVTGLFA